VRHWETRRQATAAQQNVSPQVSHAFSIALSREAGTLGTSVAQEVGRLLGWQVYDHELLEQIARDMGLRTSLLESVDERQQSWLHEVVGAYVAALVTGDEAPWVSESAFIHQLIETVLALGVHGECVIVGRGAAFILRPATTLRVRLGGPLKERIAAWRRKLNLSEREAAQRIRTTDRERTDFVRDHFRKDPTDPGNYDLVLNAPRLSVAGCAGLIVEALQRLAAHRPPGSGEHPSA
jgi:cytidylate kinase